MEYLNEMNQTTQFVISFDYIYIIPYIFVFVKCFLKYFYKILELLYILQRKNKHRINRCLFYVKHYNFLQNFHLQTAQRLCRVQYRNCILKTNIHHELPLPFSIRRWKKVSDTNILAGHTATILLTGLHG